MPPRSIRGKGGHNNRSQRGVRNSTPSRSNNNTGTREIERMADIIRPHIVTAITTVIEQVYNRSQDNTIHENEIRNVKKKIRKVRERGMHVMNEKKIEKTRKEKNRNPGKKPRKYQGTHPWCAECNWHHPGECKKEKVCYKCKKPGHFLKNCPDKTAKCTECGDYRHLRNACPKLEKDETGRIQDRVFQLDNPTARKDLDIITGTFSFPVTSML